MKNIYLYVKGVIKTKMTCLTIQDNKCWICEKPNRKLTTHHSLPHHLKPKNNVTVPICTICHQQLNSSDIKGMYAYAYKLEQLGLQVRNGAGKLLKTVKEHINMKEESKKFK